MIAAGTHSRFTCHSCGTPIFVSPELASQLTHCQTCWRAINLKDKHMVTEYVQNRIDTEIQPPNGAELNGHTEETPKRSRSQARRISAQKGEPAPTFDTVESDDAAITHARDAIAALAKKRDYHRALAERFDRALTSIVGVAPQTAPAPIVPATAKSQKAKPRAAKPKAEGKAVTERAKRGSKQEAAAATLERVIAYLKENGAKRSEEIREATQSDKSVLAIALKIGVEDGSISREGHKRSTTYSVK